MPEFQEFEVRLSSGLKGTVLRTSRFLDKREFNTVKLSNGTELSVPSGALEPQQDGSFYLEDGSGQFSRPQDEARGSDDNTPTADELNIDTSLFKEDIDMQRIPINRVLEAPVETRIEDGVTIIPVMEERLRIEKQLILREEIRIVKKRTSMRPPRVISLEEHRGEVNADPEPEKARNTDEPQSKRE